MHVVDDKLGLSTRDEARFSSGSCAVHEDDLAGYANISERSQRKRRPRLPVEHCDLGVGTRELLDPSVGRSFTTTIRDAMP
jgi:hypothetical protein